MTRCFFFLVPASEPSWIIFCGHDKLLHHQFWVESGLLSCPLPLLPLQSPPTLENPLFGYKLSRRRHIKVLFSSGFHRKTDIFHCNYNIESFYFESRPMFLLFTTVVNKPFVIRAWTPYSYSLHTHMQFHIASLPFFICVLWFACRKSLIGKIN